MSDGVPPRMRLLAAALLSISVYALPLVGPHAVSLLGEALVANLRRGHKPATWTAAEIAVALVLQLGAGAIWFWILGRLRSLRPLVLLLAVPAFFVLAEWCFLLALPTRFLIDADVAPEQRTWTQACVVPNQSVAVVGYKPAVVRASDVALVSDANGRLSRLTIAPTADSGITCTAAPIDLPPATATTTPTWISGDGRALITAIAHQTGAQSWLWIAGPGVAPVRLDEPPGRRSSDGPPVISHDGTLVAWLAPVPDSGQPPMQAVIVRSLPPRDSARDFAVIDLSAPGRGSYVIRDVDGAAREVLLAVDERRFSVVGFDGRPHGDPLRPDGVDPLHMTFRRAGAGWVAWDGYKEEDGYSLAWSLAAGRGVHRVPRGRGITDVAVHPDGRLIAISVTTSLSIGVVRDAVYVLRTRDGAEVFRRYLVRYARSSVLFPTRDLFAYTEWDGTRAAVIVLRIPSDQ